MEPRVSPKKSDPKKAPTLAQLGLSFPDTQTVTPPKANHKQRLMARIADGSIANVVVNVCGEEVPCFLLALQCHCEIFAQVEGNPRVIYLFPENVSALAFRVIYNWIATGAVLLTRETVVQVFKAASYLRLPVVQCECCQFMANDEEAIEEMAFIFYMQARHYHCEYVMSVMLPRIGRYFLVMVAQDEFLELTAKEVKMLLSASSIGVNAELEVLLAGIRWLEYDWEQRAPHLQDIVRCTRFNLMPPWELLFLHNAIRFDKLQKFESGIVQAVLTDPKVKEIVGNSISYFPTALNCYRGSPRSTRVVNFGKQNDPEGRQWIVDPLKKDFIARDVNAIYSRFCSYLDLLRVMESDYYRSFLRVQIPLNMDMFISSYAAEQN